MLYEVDESLRNMITASITNRDIEIVFEAPTKDWASRRTAPTINAFLYDIREDLTRRDVAPQLVRDDAGRVIEKRPPPRRFRLAYLLTAWTQRAQDEHRLLDALLGTFSRVDEVPPDMLPDGFPPSGLPVILQLALPPPQDRSLSDVWSALGGEMKPSLDLLVIAPVDTGRVTAVGPPVLETPRLRVDRRAVDGGIEEVVAGEGKEPGRTVRFVDHERAGAS